MLLLRNYLLYNVDASAEIDTNSDQTALEDNDLDHNEIESQYRKKGLND